MSQAAPARTGKNATRPEFGPCVVIVIGLNFAYPRTNKNKARCVPIFSIHSKRISCHLDDGNALQYQTRECRDNCLENSLRNQAVQSSVTVCLSVCLPPADGTVFTLSSSQLETSHSCIFVVCIVGLRTSQTTQSSQTAHPNKQQKHVNKTE